MSHPNLETYEANMRVYRRSLAVGDFKDANEALQTAICACPVDEALPTLAQYREDLEQKMKPVAWWAKLAGVKA